MSLEIRNQFLGRLSLHGKREAIVDETGAYSYEQLDTTSRLVASGLMATYGGELKEARIAYMLPPSFEYVAILLGIWRAGGIAVPLPLPYPPREIDYLIGDSGASITLASDDLMDRLKPGAAAQKPQLISVRQLLGTTSIDLLPDCRRTRAMILYTSGTTSRPKGVVLTHKNLHAQVSSLAKAWKWTEEDRILNVLPLHHVHGIVNVLLSAMWAGASCRMIPRFDARRTFELLSTGETTLFMAVPTIYVKLIAEWRLASVKERRRFSEACSRMRLMISGSAALPVRVLEEWKAITGHTLLERYGMTEIGMALSNPVEGPRRPGYVGQPLPGVEVKLIGEDGAVILEDNQPGELYVRGKSVFEEYWKRPRSTAAAFEKGWFKTGDIAFREQESYRIQGRSSVDIIKTGGYKVSALEIEEVLRTHPLIRECAVVGIDDDEWGERVAAAIVLKPGNSLKLQELREWAADKLALQKIPSLIRRLEELPRNALGKVVKPQLTSLWGSQAGAKTCISPEEPIKRGGSRA